MSSASIAARSATRHTEFDAVTAYRGDLEQQGGGRFSKIEELMDDERGEIFPLDSHLLLPDNFIQPEIIFSGEDEETVPQP
jgi:hypothetical protein